MSKPMKWSLGTIATLLAALAAGYGLARPAIAVVDDRYVHQAGYHLDRTVDSLTHDEELQRIYRRLARIDSGVTCMRHPQRADCE